IVNSIARFIDDLRTARTEEHDQAFRILASLAPEYLKSYMTLDGLRASRFFRETADRAGDLRADRPTVGIIGPLFARDNSDRVLEALRYASGRVANSGVANCLWIVPSVLYWGASRALETHLARV